MYRSQTSESDYQCRLAVFNHSQRHAERIPSSKLGNSARAFDRTSEADFWFAPECERANAVNGSFGGLSDPE
jgi:hypothetical protein